jgi:hypothetical protein
LPNLLTQIYLNKLFSENATFSTAREIKNWGAAYLLSFDKSAQAFQQQGK